MDTDFNSTWKDMQAKGISGPEMCNYLEWAFYARVALTGDMTTWRSIHDTACKTYSDAITQGNIDLEQTDDGLISNAFNQKLLDIINSGYVGGTKKSTAHRAVFFNFQTLTPDILAAIALSTGATVPTSTLPASSSIVLEVNNDGTIRGLLNDEEYTLGGCTAGTPCQQEAFLSHLQTNVDKIPDITEYCKRTENI